MVEPRTLSKLALEETDLTREQLEQIQLPVRFRYHNGIISELHFVERDAVWSENIKRAILNMLQVNLTPKTLEDQIDSVDKFFTIPERTIEGDCEVAYTVNSNQKNELEVVKSLNFEKCSKRVDIRYGLRYTSECPVCEKQDIRPESQTVMNFKLLGSVDSFIVKEVDLKSEYVFFSRLTKQHIVLFANLGTCSHL